MTIYAPRFNSATPVRGRPSSRPDGLIAFRRLVARVKKKMIERKPPKLALPENNSPKNSRNIPSQVNTNTYLSLTTSILTRTTPSQPHRPTARRPPPRGRAVTLHITVVNLNTTNSGDLSPKSHPNRDPNLVTALPLMGWARPAPHKGSVTTRTTTTPSPYGATPPHPGAGRETHRKILPRVDGFSTTSRTSPTEKGGSMCREGGGKGSPGVITLMNPGPYRPLYLWGLLVGGCQANRPLPRGSSLAARWSPASLGTVR
jgi:hypothetical protein